MKVWRIVKSTLIWLNVTALYVTARSFFLAMTGLGFLLGGILVYPKVYDVVDKARASWQPATDIPDCWFNWLAPTLYNWIPFSFLMFCLVWCIVFVVKGIKGPGIEETK